MSAFRRRLEEKGMDALGAGVIVGCIGYLLVLTPLFIFGVVLLVVGVVLIPMGAHFIKKEEERRKRVTMRDAGMEK